MIKLSNLKGNERLCYKEEDKGILLGVTHSDSKVKLDNYELHKKKNVLNLDAVGED